MLEFFIRIQPGEDTRLIILEQTESDYDLANRFKITRLAGSFADFDKNGLSAMVVTHPYSGASNFACSHELSLERKRLKVVGYEPAPALAHATLKDRFFSRGKYAPPAPKAIPAPSQDSPFAASNRPFNASTDWFNGNWHTTTPPSREQAVTILRTVNADANRTPIQQATSIEFHGKVGLLICRIDSWLMHSSSFEIAKALIDVGFSPLVGIVSEWNNFPKRYLEIRQEVYASSLEDLRQSAGLIDRKSVV